MAEIWGAVIIGGAALAGGAYQANQAGKAAKTAAKGADAAITEQRRQFDTLLNLTAPQRAIGEQAINALGAIYGYKPASSYYGTSPIPYGASPYEATFRPGNINDSKLGQHLERIFNPAGAVANRLGIDPNSTIGKIIDPLGGLFGSKHGDEKRNLTAFLQQNEVYDLGNGILALADGTQFSKDQLQQLAGSWYGATFAPDGDQGGWQQRYDQMLAGIRANPMNASQGGRTYEYLPDGSVREVMATGPQTSTPLTAPDYTNFFASPDYQFRRDEGLKAVQNSAAAQGGLYSGNALKGIEEFGSNLAAGEFGNYFNRQLALAGMGQTAATQAGQGAINTGANVGNLLMNQANARASGIVDQSNAINGTLNQLALLWGSGAFGGGGYRPNGLMSTGYGIPYGRAVA